MKRRYLSSLAVAAACFLALSACGQAVSSAAASPSQPASSAASSSLPPASVASSAASAQSVGAGETQDLSSFLTEEQVALYNEAHKIYLSLINMGENDGFFFATESGMEEADYNGIPYYKANGQVQNWDEFYTLVTNLYTPELFDEINSTEGEYPLWVNIDGALYASMGARGSNIEYLGPDLYRLVSKGEESIEFMVVGQYAAFDTSEAYQEEFPITLTKTPQGWRFSQFGITF